MSGYYLRMAFGSAGPWLLGAGVAVVIVAVSGRSCHDKIATGEGIDACDGFEKLAYESPALLYVGIAAAAFVGYALLRIARGVEGNRS